MMNRILSSLAIIGLMFLLNARIALAVAGGPTLTLYSSAGSYQTGDEFTVEVRIDTKSYDVSAAEVHLVYPSGAFEVVSVDAGTFLPNILTEAMAGAGEVSITVGSGIEAKSGTGTVMTMTMRSLQTGIHAIEFNVGSTQVAAIGETGDVSDILSNLFITVTGQDVEASGDAMQQTGTSTPLPTTAATGTPTITQQASQVETGPGEVTVLALVLAAIAAVVYVGYTSTDWFRREDAGDIVNDSRNDRDRFNFKS